MVVNVLEDNLKITYNKVAFIRKVVYLTHLRKLNGREEGKNFG